ncbi:type 2 lanthipeptide synthetase LanM family protein [Micromonospora echinofusca]|uniref:Type 2 lantipeptide synthetase LanM n=1 Tax=Micromonospora echinofusca TaxID=47858 RepID=A0ABS3W109_MICEH|nr:type 2 lanthipeptide synthetase LanM family protein [Micromonospora echinofusca]MBO4210358.1 type 2 lantipeptide synthetase LanM [Micromonospora echinofusca]
MSTEPSRSGSPRTRVLEPGWWAPGLALHERVGGCEELPDGPDEAGRSRFTRWRGHYDTQGLGHLFDRRLAEAGLDERRFLLLLTEAPAALAARREQPAWARLVEQAVVRAARRPPAPGGAGPVDWRDAFVRPLLPLVSTAVEWVLAHLPPALPAGYVDVPAVCADLAATLGRRLAGLAAGTFVVELHAWRDAGRLHGADGGERFADFVRRLSEPAGLVELFARYPVLARLLAQYSLFEAEALVELITRFVEDRAAIVDTVLAGSDPGPLCAANGGRGDAHQRGRTVRVLSFADGARVVYKPRGLQAQRRLAELVDWLNRTDPGLGLRTPTIVARDDHGWMEFVPHTGLTDRRQVVVFYRRLGVLLALLHSVHATDMHHENVIACGDQPVVVDAETLFHPPLPAAGGAVDPAARVLAASVSRTGLLPSIEVGDSGIGDVSGLGGGPGAHHSVLDWESAGTDQMRPVRRPSRTSGTDNRPRLHGRSVEPADYRHDLLHGFRLGYDAIAANRAGFTALVRSCATTYTRVVLRPTQLYRSLLDDANRPELLRDALDRDQVFDRLWLEAADDPVRWRTARYEAEDLWAGDVPLLRTRPGGRDLWFSTGQRLSGVFDRAGVDRVGEAVAALGPVDRHDQEWIITATLASRRPAATHRAVARRDGAGSLVEAGPDRLLAAACRVADTIVAAGSTDPDRTNWLGLELVDDRQWLVIPMGAGLAHGYLGVALFLGQLFRITGIRRYAETARRAVRCYPPLHRTLASRPDLIPVVGCGGLYGLGGIAYGLARLAVLLADTEIAALVPETVDLAAAAADERSAPDWAGGLAGCLAAMVAIDHELGLPTARDLAARCADLLLPVVGYDVPGPAPDGFADGFAGVAHALARLGATNPRYWPTAWRAVARVGTLVGTRQPRDPDPGWCSGLAGRVLAAVTAAEPAPVEAAHAVRLLTDRPLSADLSLCHGELGVLEALTALAATGRHPAAAPAQRRHTGLVLAALQRPGPRCGTPDGVDSPGLLNGLAGIGYGLLRAAFPTEVPSVLLLESPRPGGDRPR